MTITGTVTKVTATQAGVSYEVTDEGPPEKKVEFHVPSPDPRDRTFWHAYTAGEPVTVVYDDPADPTTVSVG